MFVLCEDCRTRFNDGRQSTICPHNAFLSHDEANQKDAALKLLGKEVVFNHALNEVPYYVNSVGRTGMVTLDRLSGEFAPHLFQLANTEE